jgi:hypothetical protein
MINNKVHYTNLAKEQHRKDDFDVNSVHLYHTEQWLSIKGQMACTTGLLTGGMRIIHSSKHMTGCLK